MPQSPPTYRVLIIDDNPATAGELVPFLRGCGYDVRSATTALEAVRALAGWTPHVAIADPVSGDGCGLVAAEALAALDKRPLLVALLRPSPGAIPRTKLTVFDQAFAKAASREAIAEAIASYLSRETIPVEG